MKLRLSSNYREGKAPPPAFFEVVNPGIHLSFVCLRYPWAVAFTMVLHPEVDLQLNGDEVVLNPSVTDIQARLQRGVGMKDA